MNISLPDAMRDFVDEQVTEKGYGTSSEYVRDLIRREQDRLAMRALLLDGASAPIVATADKAFFDELRASMRLSDSKASGVLEPSCAAGSNRRVRAAADRRSGR